MDLRELLIRTTCSGSKKDEPVSPTRVIPVETFGPERVWSNGNRGSMRQTQYIRSQRYRVKIMDGTRPD